jgi:hypothetical protein
VQVQVLVLVQSPLAALGCPSHYLRRRLTA